MGENRKTLPQMIRFTARNSPNRLTRRLGRFLPRCNSDALSINASPEFQYNAPKLKQLEDNAGRHFQIPLAWATMRFPSPTHTKTLTTTRAKVLSNDALKILDVITSKGSPTAKGAQTQTHLRLIQDFLHPAIHQQTLNGFAFSPSKTKRLSNELDQILDLTSTNHRRHFEGSRIDASILSNAVSSFGCERNLHGGAPCHCVALKTGFIFNVYVGSSLITMYGKCGESESAYKVFEEMPVRNVVSWTAIIAGFSQEFHVDVCLQLFQQMKKTTLKPNEYTFTSVLIACSGSGALLQGRNTHCQIIQMGFESHIHISNTLISMYCKSGAFLDATRVFENLSDKDIVSWNSMIAGYAQHGLSAEAIRLFEKMKDQSVNPDTITFLAILSSCRHEGLVSKGQYYFNLMAKHGLDPELDHYSCVVDLLGRAGMLEEAKDFIEKMPISPNSVIWGSLLSSCRLHGNVRIGIEAAENRLLIEPECAATHVQLVNLYARAGRQGHAAKLRTLMKDRGMKMSPGYSWIEIQNKVHRFGAEDMSNDKIVDILVFVDSMVDHMNSIGSWESVEFDD